MSGGEVSRHFEDLTPAALNSLDIIKIVERHRAFVVKAGMTSEEVAMGDEQDGEGDSAVEILEAAAGSGVEFISAIEAFNDLLKLSVFSAFLVLVGQADDRVSFNREGGTLEQSRVVDGVDSRVIGRVAVADEFGGDIFRHSSECFGKGDITTLHTSPIRCSLNLFISII